MNSTNLSLRLSAHFYLDFSIMLFLSVSFYLFSCLSYTPKKNSFSSANDRCKSGCGVQL